MQKLTQYLKELNLTEIPANIPENRFIAICDKIKSGEANGWVYGDFHIITVAYLNASEIKFNRLGKTYLN